MTITVIESFKSTVHIISNVPHMEIEEIDQFLTDHGFIGFEWMISENDPQIKRYKANLEIVQCSNT